jgi:hypothetical protein
LYLVRFYIVLIILCLFSLNSCVSSSQVNIKSKAESAGFQSQSIKTNNFNLFSLLKNENENTSNLVVYIEGDGRAWKKRTVLSSDPTPKNPLSLKLAIKDPAALVLYLARPCQYLEKSKLEACAQKYWSSHRYSNDVVESMSKAITKFKTQSDASSVEIIGFSGGGVIAMLIAAQRNDINKIITVAANIDHESWSEWHGVTKLKGSLMPLDYLAELENIDQFHYWGGNDEIVPYKTQSKFIDHSKSNPLFKYEVIPDFTHDCCWLEHWSELLQR